MGYATTAAIMAALLAWCIASRLGIPLWEAWGAGDKFDLTLLTGLLVFYSLKAISA